MAYYRYYSLALLIAYWLSIAVSQEDYIPSIQCVPPHYYFCKNGNCLPESHVCDGDNDCGDNSDEEPSMCSSIQCSDNEFQCKSGRCVPKEAKCDRQRQCRDGSDELECLYPACADGLFACANNSQCLNADEVCDGTIDCKDGLASDERHPSPCQPNVTCPAYAFKCKNTNICALPNWMCDGDNDCGDNSDEDKQNCREFKCPQDWFRCGNDRCIPVSTVCNGVIDCKDGMASDERHPSPCPRNVSCPQGFFSCDETNICAHPHWLCDGSDDCGDKSDENPERCAATECPDEWFRCRNNRCIPPNWRCDGGVDCRDAEDEADCDNIKSLSDNSTSSSTGSPNNTVETATTNKLSSASMLKPPTSAATSSYRGR